VKRKKAVEDKEFVLVAQTSEIAPGQVKVVAVEGQAICLANASGRFYAFADVCTHDDGPLAEGELDDCAITCPRHGARFDISTGAVLSFPAVVPIPVYDLKVEGTAILVSRTPRN
jgi:3-phenylpropionate/trans-cinnamate dioxygenase ferredoxin subunit